MPVIITEHSLKLFLVPFGYNTYRETFLPCLYLSKVSYCILNRLKNLSDRPQPVDQPQKLLIPNQQARAKRQVTGIHHPHSSEDDPAIALTPQPIAQAKHRNMPPFFKEESSLGDGGNNC
jgi:hypothetical protein